MNRADLKEKLTNFLRKPIETFKTLVPNNYIDNKKKVILVSSLAGVIALGSFGFFHYQANATTIYHVFVDGEQIGTVNDKNIIETWQNQRLNEEKNKYNSVALQATNQISFEEEVRYKGEYNNEETLQTLANTFNVEAKGVEIVVDGKVIGVVKDQATADRIMENLKESYKPKADKQKGKVVAASISESSSDKNVKVESIDFKEEVNTGEAIVAPDKITDEVEMLQLIKKGTLEEKTYTVQANDTISEIAVKYGLTSDQLYQLNPEIEGELIHIGDELNVTALTPLITVESEEKLTQMEAIPYRVSYEKNSSMFVNESKVKVSGKEGKKEVEYKIVKENGIVIEKEVVSEKVVEKPIEKVIIKGTKPVPVRGSGNMTWPAMGGVITSYYGPRWGTFHNALDISGVSDRTLKAADNGKIIWTGWKGGYGKTVMIDHGNGIVTLYAHMSSISVNYGDRVAKGQKIGVMGTTGNSTGVHVHFEVRVNGVPKNPLNYVGI